MTELEQYLAKTHKSLISEYESYVYNAQKQFDYWRYNQEAKQDIKSDRCNYWETELEENKTILTALKRTSDAEFYGLQDRWGEYLFASVIDRIKKLKIDEEEKV